MNILCFKGFQTIIKNVKAVYNGEEGKERTSVAMDRGKGWGASDDEAAGEEEDKKADNLGGDMTVVGIVHAFNQLHCPISMFGKANPANTGSKISGRSMK